MGQKLPPDQMALYRRVDEVLTYVWDPIGIKEIPEGRDEYRGYLPQVFKRVLDATEPGSIAEYLLAVESESMGLSLNGRSRKEALRISMLLIKHRDLMIDTYPDQ